MESTVKPLKAYKSIVVMLTSQRFTDCGISVVKRGKNNTKCVKETISVSDLRVSDMTQKKLYY